MANVQITWPKSKKPIKGQRFVASGWTDAAVFGVFGECRPKTQPGPAIMGRLLTFHMEPARKDRAFYYHWMIVFTLHEYGRYELRVTGLTADGQQEMARRDFTSRPVPLRAITIAWPENNENITSEASNFAPYGGLTINPLGSVTMTDAHSHVINPTYQYGDPTDLDMWTAQFPTIPAGTWKLRATDSTGANVAVASGLIVT
jgi:hypothetical protein